MDRGMIQARIGIKLDRSEWNLIYSLFSIGGLIWTELFLFEFKIGTKSKIQIKDFVDNLILTAYVLRLGF